MIPCGVVGCRLPILPRRIRARLTSSRLAHLHAGSILAQMTKHVSVFSTRGFGSQDWNWHSPGLLTCFYPLAYPVVSVLDFLPTASGHWAVDYRVEPVVHPVEIYTASIYISIRNYRLTLTIPVGWVTGWYYRLLPTAPDWSYSVDSFHAIIL